MSSLSKNPIRQVLKNGELQEAPDSEVDYEFTSPSQLFTHDLNLIPFENAVQAQRTFYTTKFWNQALPIEHGEVPYIQTLRDPKTNESFHNYVGRKMGVVSANDEDDGATVSKITPDEMTLTLPNGKKVIKPLYNNYSFNRKSYLSNTPVVKVGDKIKKNQVLAKSNYTDDNGNLAMGTNARVAIVPYKGWTYEDSIVVSEDFAKRMASQHMYRYYQDKDDDKLKTGKTHYHTLFPDKFDKDQLEKIDDNGVIKVGQKVNYGDPLILSSKARMISSHDAELGRLSKYLKNTRNDAAVKWEHHSEGEVTDVVKTKNGWRVNVKTTMPLKEGDKLTQLSGSKGTVSKIIPMNEMPRTLDGKPLDILINPLTIPSRVNSSMIMSVLLGKVAEKTGKRYVLPSFNHKDESWYDFVEKELRDNNIPEVEDIYDPSLDSVLDQPVTVGNEYFLKLHHVGESKLSARDQGIYTMDMQPAKGGESGQKAKRQSGLENTAMLSAGAYNVIKDSLHLRGEKNDDYWRQVRMGQTPSLAKKSPFVWDKYIALMQGSGINPIDRGNSTLQASPFTDSQFERMQPIELKNAHIIDLKNFKPVEGGLFDPGMNLRDKWGKITLSEPYPNPGFEDAIVSLLGIRKSDMYDIMQGNKNLGKYGSGNIAIYNALKNIDMDAMYKDARDQFKNGPKSSKQKYLNRIKYLKGLKANDLTPNELMITRVPVIPAKFRPYAVMGDTFLPGDVNELYKDVFQLNQVQKELNSSLGYKHAQENALNMYNSIKALYGFAPSKNRKLIQRGVSGFMNKLVGDTSKFSYLNRVVNSKPVDQSARGVIEMSPELNMDEIDIPNEMAYTIFAPYIQRELVKGGMRPRDAIRAIKNRDEATAGKALDVVMKERPLWFSRAPSWHSLNTLGAYAKRHEGNNILISPVVSTGAGADNDGDSQIGIVYVAIKK